MRPRDRFQKATTRGFTLVELLVAMIAGVIVAIAALILSKNATRFFQHEARITAAQLAATLGMSRLEADIQRAAFMSSPNVGKDPFVCGDFAGWPAGLSALQGIQITQSGSVTLHGAEVQQSVDNGMSPDSIVIGGSFASTEQFAVRTIQTGAGGAYTVYLQTDSAPMARALTAANAGGEPICPDVAGSLGIFRPGRFLRIVDAQGRHEYGLINGCDDTDATNIVLTLAANPVVPQKTPATTCGFSGLATGLLVNSVSRVRYDIRSLKGHPRYGGLVAPSADATSAKMSGDGTGVATDPGRTELVRVELDAAGAEIATSLELVAEYAVDLKLGVTSTVLNATNPTVNRFAVGDLNGYALAAPNVTAGSAPERIRAVALRLSTRARAPDRDAPAPSPPGGGVGTIGRFQLFNVPGPDRDGDGKPDVFARMRTLQADIALPNQTSVPW